MTYAHPTDLNDALRVAAEGGGTVIAGGTDVYPAMQQGQSPAAFLDLTRIPDLSGITTTSDGFRIGATTTWSDIIAADLPPAFDALKAAAREVGSVQIQNAGTIAGNLCNASPAADGVPPLLILDAEVELASAARGTRSLPLAEFLRGVRQTALEADELMTAILIPPVPKASSSAFEKLGSRKYLVISITMTAVLLEIDKNRISNARVAVGACSPVAQRLPALERELVGQDPAHVVISDRSLSPLSPIDDVRGSGAYRLDAVAEQIARSVRKAGGHE